ncbi:unnamed protein product [Urochloa decumbens]|uniref:Uncharacterized protein n=1 Tax=Urochloa decumbens TaxID=240449 RepID=A0ABC8X3J2_9POAL
MDWVLLRDGSDSDGSASEDGSDSGFAIVRVRKDHRSASATASPAVDSAAAEAPLPAMAAAVPRPAPPPGLFKVVSYGEAFSAATSSTDDGGGLLDEATIREALFGEHGGAGISVVEAPPTCSMFGSTVSPCDVQPGEVAGGMEEEDAEGEEEDAEISAGEEEEEEEDGGVDESSSVDCFEIPATIHPGHEATASDANGDGKPPALSGRTRYTSYEDVDDDESEDGYIDMTPSSSMTRTHTELRDMIRADRALLDFLFDRATRALEPPQSVCRSYDDIDDSGCDTEGSDSDAEEEEEGEEEAEEESTKRSGLVCRGYDDVDSGSDVEEESASVACAMNSTEPGGAMARVDRTLLEFFFDRPARALEPPQAQLSGYVCRSYDDIDSGSDMVEESDSGVEDDEGCASSEAEESCVEGSDHVQESTKRSGLVVGTRRDLLQAPLPQLAGCVRSYDDIDSGCSDEDDGIEGGSGSDVEEEGVKPPGLVGRRGYDDVDSGSDVEEESASVACDLNSTVARDMFRTYRLLPLYECLLERVARDLLQVPLPQLSGCVSRSYDDIDSGSDMEESDCDAEEEEDEEEEEEEEYEEEEEEEEEEDEEEEEEEDGEESCCEDEDDIDCRCPEEYDSDDDIDTSGSETDKSDRNSSSDAEESDDDVHDVCGQCGHVVQTSKQPVELGSISDYGCFDPDDVVVRPAKVIFKNGKPIYIVYDDGDVSGMDGDEDEAAGAESPARSSALAAQSTAQAGRNREPALEDLKRRVVTAKDTMELEDLLQEMLGEHEAARPGHGGAERRGALESDGGDIDVGAVMAEDTLELRDLLLEMAEEFEAARPEHGGRESAGGGGGIGVEEASRGASSSTRGGLAASLDAARERELAAALEEMERWVAALQGWRETLRQATRRLVAESGDPPAQAQERDGQSGEGSPTADLTSVMVCLLVCLATILF